MTEETSEVLNRSEKPSLKTRDKVTSKRDKAKLLNKVVIRRLPPSMTEETFLEQVEPLPDNENYYFVPADWSLGHDATARAYIHFLQQDDIFLFKDRFDGYVFVDNKGGEYPAIVEFAPFQGMPRNKSRKKDPKANSIETDAHYISFLENLNKEDNEGANREFKLEYSYQIKDDKKITSTPLLQYLANKKQERRDERKRRLDEKRRQRDDDRQRKRNQVAKSISQTIKEEESKDIDNDKDKNSEMRRDREKFDDRKESRNRRRDQKRKEERERNLQKMQEKQTEKVECKDAENDDRKKKDSKKYSQTRREKQRSREENRKVEYQINNKDQRNKDFNNSNPSSSINADKEIVNSNDDVSETVKEFIRSVASCKEFVPRNRDMPSTSKEEQSQSDNETVMTEVRDKLQQLNILERNKSMDSNDSTGDKTSENRIRDSGSYAEKRRDDKNARRIRNKKIDRPSLEIYQPRKMRLPSSQKEEGGRSSSELKDYKSNPPSDCESKMDKDEKKEKEEKTGVRKKVSRYSERRSGRTRDRSRNNKEVKDRNLSQENDKRNDAVKENVEMSEPAVDIKNGDEKSEMLA